MAKIDDVTTEGLRDTVAQAMVRMASQGSVPAATAVLKLLDDIEQRAAAAEHAERLTEIGDDTIMLCQYLGELGVSEKDAARRIGRDLSKAEIGAFEDGKRERQLEMHAVGLAKARRGIEKPERWMLK